MVVVGWLVRGGGGGGEVHDGQEREAAYRERLVLYKGLFRSAWHV